MAITATFQPIHLIVPPECLPALHKLRIHTLLDLLHYYPRDHVTYHWVTIPEARVGEQVMITGKIQQHRILTPKKGRLTSDRLYSTNRDRTPLITPLNKPRSLHIHRDQVLEFAEVVQFFQLD